MKIKPGLFALIVGGLMFITLTSLVYAFIQQIEAERQRELAIECLKDLEKSVSELDHKNKELIELTNQLRQQITVSEENLLKAQEAAKKAAIQSKNKK
jgi:hypothetical protein